uniref:Uncharacterized protein n=1 Tax=Heterorhabditis bacteriophora TaxID=37862 RepID=A0A1I7W977_HETBA
MQTYRNAIYSCFYLKNDYYLFLSYCYRFL